MIDVEARLRMLARRCVHAQPLETGVAVLGSPPVLWCPLCTYACCAEGPMARLSCRQRSFPHVEVEWKSTAGIRPSPQRLTSPGTYVHCPVISDHHPASPVGPRFALRTFGVQNADADYVLPSAAGGRGV